ncbi:autoinducer binding domain-containing protein [Palleronia abyssalis]|uniref:Regulatory protein SdiA n=1 Tax=Palleronia abyssalis TaxID=1501240 RepID=A0A2R8BZD7_9RHOB|nr:autoinducer binding domain-containing protein [Palleronia abyssalis]SPJ25512.1 Regulatory protein SdiA [Palleronia abyssalis]
MNDLEDFLQESPLEALAPSGYHIALRVGFAFPEVEHNTFPRAWIETYTQSGFMLHDPVIRWIYDNVGTISWSQVAGADARGVLQVARTYDLAFGAVVSMRDEEETGIRSFGNFARADREFTADELAMLQDLVIDLHARTRPPQSLTSAELKTLELLGTGLLMKEIAYQLGISESAVKQRLANAKVKMSARTTTQAVLQATQLGWI